MAARKVSTAMFRMPFRREEEELGPGWLVVWALAVPPQVTHMSPTHTSLHCCKIWQQMAGDCCLSKRIISPLSGLLREAALLLSLTISAWYTDDSSRLQMHPSIYKQPRLINLEDPGLSAARGAWRTPVSKRKWKRPVGGARRGAVPVERWGRGI